MSHEQTFEAMQSKVIDRAIQVKVDNGPRGTWPGDILVKAARRLCNDVGSEELTPFKIHRALEDIVIEDSWGSFYWDSENKRHLRLNPPDGPIRARRFRPHRQLGLLLDLWFERCPH